MFSGSGKGLVSEVKVFLSLFGVVCMVVGWGVIELSIWAISKIFGG